MEPPGTTRPGRGGRFLVERLEPRGGELNQIKDHIRCNQHGVGVGLVVKRRRKPGNKRMEELEDWRGEVRTRRSE